MAGKSIFNYLPVTERLSTGGQPSEEQLRELASSGCESVINLGLLGTDYALDDEAGFVRSLGMAYRHIPVDFERPTRENLAEFLEAMDEEGGKQIFVHCAANYRVSCFVAVYGLARLGWSDEDATRHVARIWQPNETWAGFLERARREHGPDRRG